VTMLSTAQTLDYCLQIGGLVGSKRGKPTAVATVVPIANFS
jgi:hypothetical protein